MSDLERWLRQNRTPLLGDTPPPDDTHLPDERLAAVAEGSRLTPAERGHLGACSECRAVLAEVGALQPTPPVARPRAQAGWVALALGLLGTAAALVVWWRPVGDSRVDSGTYHARGSDAGLAPEVIVLAHDAAGTRRTLSAGASVRPTDRLGFVYGNPAGVHRTLTVLGWDGARVHWYYPERLGDPPVAVRPERSVRLPFDVGLEDHSPGPLTVVAVFDTDPQALARDLAASGPPPHAHVLVLEVIP